MRTLRDVDGGDWLRICGRYRRALCGGGGGGGTTKVTSTTVIPPKTPEELALLGKQNELLDIQLSELRRQNDLLTDTFPEQKALFQAQTEAATSFAQMQKLSLAALPGQLALQTELQQKALKALELTPDQEEIQKLSDQRALATLRGEPIPISQAQQAQLDTIYGAAQSQGEADIRRFGEDLAASRGLRLTDAPIGAEVLRQQRDLTTQLKGAKASATLNLGLGQQAFDESVRQFQSGLRLAADQNRLALLGRVQSGGPGTTLPYPGQSPAISTNDSINAFSAITPLINSMTGERVAGATRTEKSTFTTDPGAFGYVKALLGAIGGAAGSVAASSARFKKDIVPLDRDEYRGALRKLRETPVTRWRYTWEADDGRPHVGPILEMSPSEIKASDTHLDLLSYSGMLHAGLKGLDRDVEELRATLREARR